jgi:hypothetical protein
VRFLASSFTAIKAAQVDGLFRSQEEKKMAKQEHGQVVETAIEARGAERGPTVRNVLVWSLSLVVAAFAVVYFLYLKT